MPKKNSLFRLLHFHSCYFQIKMGEFAMKTCYTLRSILSHEVSNNNNNNKLKTQFRCVKRVISLNFVNCTFIRLININQVEWLITSQHCIRILQLFWVWHIVIVVDIVVACIAFAINESNYCISLNCSH